MVTLKVKNSLNDVFFKVPDVDLNTDTPIGIVIRIVSRDSAQKPPTGKIWVMKRALTLPGDPEIDQFATFADNGLDETIDYALVLVGK